MTGGGPSNRSDRIVPFVIFWIAAVSLVLIGLRACAAFG